MKVEDAMDAAENAKAALGTGASLWRSLMGTDTLPAQETEAALAAERVEIMRELLMDAVEKAARARVGSRSWADNAKAARAECDEAWKRAEQFAEAADDANVRVRELQDQLLDVYKRAEELEARVPKRRRKRA
jgi:hypothetical protein